MFREYLLVILTHFFYNYFIQQLYKYEEILQIKYRV